MDSSILLESVQTVRRCFIERAAALKAVDYSRPDFTDLQAIADELAKASTILLEADTGTRCGLGGVSQNGPRWFNDLVVEFGTTQERRPWAKGNAKATRVARRERIASLDA